MDLMQEASEDRRSTSTLTHTNPKVNGTNSVESDEEEDNSGGYHSDQSDSTVMMSGNSPFISASARYNFLQRSGKEITILINLNLRFLCENIDKEPSKNIRC